MITQTALQALLHYDPETGAFTWKTPPRGKVAGAVAGCTDTSTGYVKIGIAGWHYRAHRLAFLYMTGQWPEGPVDHIDHDRSNNAWTNLRATTTQGNSQNKVLQRNNASGVTGVRWDPAKRAWAARIEVNGRRVHLGFFVDYDEAVEARKAAEVEHGFHPNHGCHISTFCKEFANDKSDTSSTSINPYKGRKNGAVVRNRTEDLLITKQGRGSR